VKDNVESEMSVWKYPINAKIEFDDIVYSGDTFINMDIYL